MERIVSWGTGKLINVNDQKSQFQPMILFHIEDNPYVIFKNTIKKPNKTIHIFGLTVLSNLYRKQQISKSASPKLGILF